MEEITDFLGEVAARVVQDLMMRGHLGIRLQNVTSFNPETFLAHFNGGRLPLVVTAGFSAKDLVKKTKYPAKLLTADIAKGTEWRNDPQVTETVVLIAFGEEERLGSFHRFTEVRDRDLYEKICQMAKENICPNKVQTDWWTVLCKSEVKGQMSVYRLAAYYLYLQQQPKNIPEASREGLFFLGLLPSSEFFEHASPAQLLRNYKANRHLIQRIEILSNADRDKLTRCIEAADPSAQPELLKTLGKVFKYNRSGLDNDRRVLTFEEVRALFEAKKKSTRKSSSSRSITAERAGIDAILDGEEQELELMGQKLRETIGEFPENETPSVSIDIPSRTEQATLKIPPALVRLLSRAITSTSLGGIFKVASAFSLDSALDDIDNGEFKPFLVEGDKNSPQSMLDRIVKAKLVEPEVFQHWLDFIKAREILVEDAITIAVSPMLAFASSKKFLQAGKQYLESYEHLMSSLRDRYESIASQSPQGARHLCAQLLIMDTILLETGSGVYAILSPLHPLHLWKYVKLTEQIRDEKGTLSQEYKQVLGESAEKLPHFITALFVPEGLVSNQHALVLPESHQIATLPCYQQESPHFSGNEGQDRLLRILRKFIVLYPHAKECLRVCLVDPPDFSGFLEQTCNQVLQDELPISGMNLSVYRTLDRPLTLGYDDQQLESIANVFSPENNTRFSLNVESTQTTYQDILTTIRQSPVHILAVFDPSRAKVGQFSHRNTGLVHPLVLPKEFRYDPIEDHLEITPAPTGDIFDLYYNIQNRLNNSLTESHFGISSSLGPNFPATSSLLQCCTWLVIGDKLIDAFALNGGQIISFEAGRRRDVIVVSENMTKFERAFGYYLRKVNLDPPEEAIRELITSSAELVGEGLLGLIRPDGEE